MASSLEPEQRYPKRRRIAVMYSEAVGVQDESDQDHDTVAGLDNRGSAVEDEVQDSDDDGDWALKPNRKKNSKRPKRKKQKTKEPKPFPFMELPPELREAVYKLVVGNPDGLVKIEPSMLTNLRVRRTLEEAYRLDPTAPRMHLVQRTLFRNLRLLRVSKVIYAEAAVVMYTKQIFAFTRLTALQSFILLVRPETLDRLIHVRVDVGEAEWPFMPGVASQLLQLRYLQTLQICGRGPKTCCRGFSKYLTSTGRPERNWPVTIESFDKLKAIKYARDIYPYMYPFFNAVIRAGSVVAEGNQQDGIKDPKSENDSNGTPESSLAGCSEPAQTRASIAHLDEQQKSPYKPLVGVDALVQTMEMQEHRHPYGNWFGDWGLSNHFAQFRSKAMNRDRRSTRRTAMKEELLKLMAEDSF